MSPIVDRLYRVTEEDIAAVRKVYGKTEEDIKKDCEAIKEWMKQQAHFPDDYDSDRVEKFLLKNKFRVEQTKKKLENYYTMKSRNIDYLRKMDPLDETMKTSYITTSLVPLPYLVNNTERIYIQRYTGHEDLYTWKANVLLALALLEVELTKEYCVGMRVIMDFGGFSISHLKTIEISDVSKSFFMFQECFSARILGIEYINTNPAVSMLLNILKLGFTEKLYKKITIHKDLDSLKKVIPEEYLPSDFGGKLRSMSEIQEDVKKCLIENRDYLMQRLEVSSDETKRVGVVEKNELFGVDGTFKKINLD